MRASTPARPVSRARVLVGALVLATALGAVVAGSRALRHPAGEDQGVVEADEQDVRDDVVCPGPVALEADQPRPPVPVTSNDLYACPRTYDGQPVRVQGEVVGALMSRRDGTWTQLNDDPYAGDLGPLPTHRDFRGSNAGVGVLLPPQVAGQVQAIGGPRARGDVLDVVGTFHRIDEETREAAIIRADTATITRRGGPVDHPPLRLRQVVGVLLAMAAAGMTAAERIARRR